MASFLRFPFLTTKSGTPESSADKGTAPSEVPIVDPMTFESIADRFETLQADLAYAQDLCDQANIQFDMYRTEIDGLKNHTALLMQQLAQRTAMCKEFHAQSDRHRHDLRKERTLNTQLLARLKTETTTLKAMTNQAQMAQRNLADAKFDIEYLKCTTSMDKPLLPPLLPNDETPLPPRPFVVVLVDGDAYKWSSDLFAHGGLSEKTPGSLAAMQIKFEVTKYIRDQRGTIPMTSAIITRVFQNFKSFGKSPLEPSRRNVPRRDWDAFSLQFTEKFPLFDFFDAGRGKERVDEKIREHFHLFLSHPNCYAIFLAACQDNGFARMLEPYVNHPSIREKIILVSSGYKAPEIAELPFNTVMWPTVFSLTRAPKEVMIKIARNARDRQVAKSSSKFSLDKNNRTRARTEDLTPRTENISDLLQPWDVHRALAQYFGEGTLRFNGMKRVEQANLHDSCTDSHAEQEIE